MDLFEDTIGSAEAVQTGRRAERWGKVFRKLLRNRGAVFGSIMVLGVIVSAVFAPLLSPHDPIASDVDKRLLPPIGQAGSNRDYMLGTDYLGRDIVVLRELYENSSIRLARAAELSRACRERSTDTMQSVLSDRADPANSICQSYRRQFMLGEIGTVCSIVFDLQAGVMHFRKGNAPDAPFHRYRVSED